MTSGTGDDDTKKEMAAERFVYHHIKGAQFRVIHVDGGVGGITPRGFCHLAVYNERLPIPQVSERAVIGKNEVGPELTVATRFDEEPGYGLVREIEVDLLFDESTARELRDWLDRRIRDFETLRGEATDGGE